MVDSPDVEFLKVQMLEDGSLKTNRELAEKKSAGCSWKDGLLVHSIIQE